MSSPACQPHAPGTARQTGKGAPLYLLRSLLLQISYTCANRPVPGDNFPTGGKLKLLSRTRLFKRHHTHIRPWKKATSPFAQTCAVHHLTTATAHCRRTDGGGEAGEDTEFQAPPRTAAAPERVKLKVSKTEPEAGGGLGRAPSSSAERCH